jgi:hypothetical protein
MEWGGVGGGGKQIKQMTSTHSLSLEKFSSHSIDGMISFIHPKAEQHAQNKNPNLLRTKTLHLFSLRWHIAIALLNTSESCNQSTQCYIQ